MTATTGVPDMTSGIDATGPADATDRTTTTNTTGTISATGTTGTTGTVELLTSDGWFPVCAAEVLEPGRGVAVLLPGSGQAALFRDRTGSLYALGNVDPFTGAGVLCHGLLGSADGRAYVASPLLKQRFDLADGRCLDDDGVRVATYQVRVA